MAHSKVLPHYKNIYEAISVDPEVLLNRLDGWSNFAKETINTDNITDIIKDVEFYEYAIEVDCELSNFLIDIFSKYLISVTEDEWFDAFVDEDSYLSKSTYWLLKGNKIKTIPENAISAYKRALKEIAEGEIDVPSKSYNVYYEKINKNKLKSTYKDIRDIFINHQDISPEQFLFFFEKFLEHGKLVSRADDVVRRIINPVIDNDDCLLLIIKNEESTSKIISKAGDDAVDLKDSIKRKAEQANDELLINFAIKIGIDLTNNEDPEDDEDDDPDSESVAA